MLSELVDRGRGEVLFLCTEGGGCSMGMPLTFGSVLVVDLAPSRLAFSERIHKSFNHIRNFKHLSKDRGLYYLCNLVGLNK